MPPHPGHGKNIRDHRNMLSREYFNRQSVSVAHISIDEVSVSVAHSLLTPPKSICLETNQGFLFAHAVQPYVHCL